MMLHIAQILFLQFLIIQNGDGLLPIFSKSFSSAEKENLTDEVHFDAKKNIFPVIRHHEHCLHNLTFCPGKNPDRHTVYNISCNFENLCPNGTRPQCVEKKENVSTLRGILWICSPFKSCDRGSRDIVKYDPNEPDIYQLGNERCPDGYYHKVYTSPEDSYCFSECKQDMSVRVFHKSTPERGPIVYCNYPDYCSREKPKLFEYQPSELSPCKLVDEQGHSSCPANSERLSDCKCDTICQNGFKRHAVDDFICKRPPQPFRPADKLSLKDVMSIYQHSSGICLIWHFPNVDNLTDIAVEVSYLDIADNQETYINQTFISKTHIDGLVPGKAYDITVKISYKYGNQTKTFTQKHKETMRPKSVVNLTVTTDGDIIELDCFASKGSRQDHFDIEYRTVRRNPETSWDKQNVSDCTLKLNEPFPGEEYKFKVTAVSKGVLSNEVTASIIVPPRPPKFLRSSVSYPNHVTISWSHDESVNHVEEWYLTYNSSGGDVGKRKIRPLKDERLVETMLDNLVLGQTYSVLVQSSVGGVNSLKPTLTEFIMPKEDSEWSILKLVVIIASITVFVFAVIGCLWKYHSRLHAPRIVKKKTQLRKRTLRIQFRRKHKHLCNGRVTFEQRGSRRSRRPITLRERRLFALSLPILNSFDSLATLSARII